MFSCRKEAFAACFRHNSAPSHGEHHTGFSYPKCNYLLYSVWVIPTRKRRGRESSSEPRSPMPQQRNMSSVASLVTLLRWKHPLQPWALVLLLESLLQPLDTDQIMLPCRSYPSCFTGHSSRYMNTLATPLTAFSSLLGHHLPFQKVIPRPFNEVKSSIRTFKGCIL